MTSASTTPRGSTSVPLISLEMDTGAIPCRLVHVHMGVFGAESWYLSIWYDTRETKLDLFVYGHKGLSSPH